MKVIFHHRFYDVYTADPAAARGRMESMVSALEGQEYDFIGTTEPATERIWNGFTAERTFNRSRASRWSYELGCLAPAGAILAAETRLLPVNRLLV